MVKKYFCGFKKIETQPQIAKGSIRIQLSVEVAVREVLKPFSALSFQQIKKLHQY